MMVVNAVMVVSYSVMVVVAYAVMVVAYTVTVMSVVVVGSVPATVSPSSCSTSRHFSCEKIASYCHALWVWQLLNQNNRTQYRLL